MKNLSVTVPNQRLVYWSAYNQVHLNVTINTLWSEELHADTLLFPVAWSQANTINTTVHSRGEEEPSFLVRQQMLEVFDLFVVVQLEES